MKTSAKNINEIKTATANKRFAAMKEQTNGFLQDVKNLHVYISKGNNKTGDLVPSVSLRPVLDCGNCAACCKLCYDLRNDCVYSNVQKTRSKNAAIFNADPDRYFNEISGACKSFVSFRWHIGGDIKNRRYLDGIIQVANENKHCKFLIFTKMFNLINSYLDGGGLIPENLQIIFSGWYGQKMNNPYNLPESHPVFTGGKTSARDGAKLCTGNCSECLLKGQNCWTLKHGEQVIFFAH